MNFWLLFLACAWIGHKPAEPPLIKYRDTRNKTEFTVERCGRCKLVYWANADFEPVKESTEAYKVLAK